MTEDEVALLQEELSRRSEDVRALWNALHDAIALPRGIVPASAARFYDSSLAEAALGRAAPLRPELPPPRFVTVPHSGEARA